LTLVISQTLRHGVKEGVKVALAPIVTDFPIILISVLILAKFSGTDTFLGIISLTGGLFVLYLAYESIRSKSFDPNLQKSAPKSLSKGAVVNALNPHPYIFWITVGTPFMIRAWKYSPMAAVGFISGFYIFLVGSKITVAVVSGKSKRFLQGNIYTFLMRILGVLLFIFALILLKDGLNSIGLIS
jgi:threonine/homoserine/homoserine lactone efflux protein